MFRNILNYTAIGFLLFCSTACYYSTDIVEQPLPHQIEVSPSVIRGHTILGNYYDSDEFQNKPMVLNFWFPSCPPCTMELKTIEKIHREHNNSIEVVGIMLLGLDTEEDGKKFLEKNKITFPTIPDTYGIINTFEVTSFPTTIFLDSNHYVKDSWVGIIDENTLEEKIFNLK